MNCARGAILPMALTILLLAAPIGARAQVAVYHLKFQATGQSVNYQGYNEGFFAMPLSGGDVSFIFMLENGLGKQFVQSDNLGTFFAASEGSISRGVLASASGTGTPLNFFTAVGILNESVRATVITTDPDTDANTASIVTVKLPQKMTGYILTADDTGNGSAGTSTLTATLDPARTRTANLHQWTVDEALQAVVAQLIQAGYAERPGESSAADTANTGNTTPNTPGNS